MMMPSMQCVGGDEQMSCFVLMCPVQDGQGMPDMPQPQEYSSLVPVPMSPQQLQNYSSSPQMQVPQMQPLLQQSSPHSQQQRYGQQQQLHQEQIPVQFLTRESQREQQQQNQWPDAPQQMQQTMRGSQFRGYKTGQSLHSLDVPLPHETEYSSSTVGTLGMQQSVVQGRGNWADLSLPFHGAQNERGGKMWQGAGRMHRNADAQMGAQSPWPPRDFRSRNFADGMWPAHPRHSSTRQMIAEEANKFAARRGQAPGDDVTKFASMSGFAQGRGKNQRRNPRRGNNGVDFVRGIVGDAGPNVERESMRTHLQSLQQQDPATVFIARRINKLGFSSPDILRAHFSRYGKVKDIFVSHSRVKFPSRRPEDETQWRLRPAALGFIVMDSAETTSQILREGPEQCVHGVNVLIQHFERWQGDAEATQEPRADVNVPPAVDAVQQEPARSLSPSSDTLSSNGTSGNASDSTRAVSRAGAKQDMGDSPQKESSKFDAYKAVQKAVDSEMEMLYKEMVVNHA